MLAGCWSRGLLACLLTCSLALVSCHLLVRSLVQFWWSSTTYTRTRGIVSMDYVRITSLTGKASSLVITLIRRLVNSYRLGDRMLVKTRIYLVTGMASSLTRNNQIRVPFQYTRSWRSGRDGSLGYSCSCGTRTDLMVMSHLPHMHVIIQQKFLVHITCSSNLFTYTRSLLLTYP